MKDEKNRFRSATPNRETYSHNAGLTKIEYAAIQILAGNCANPAGQLVESYGAREHAELALSMANALFDQLEAQGDSDE